MKKQKGRLSLVVVILAATILFSSAALAKQIELSVNLFMAGTQHPRWDAMMKPWLNMLEERAEGRLKLTVYFASALAKPRETFDSTIAGVADIAEGMCFATPGRFLVSDIATLPEMGLSSALSCSRALWDIYKTFPEVQAEWAGVKVLVIHVAPPTKVITRKTPVRSLEDLKGLKIWTPGLTQANTGKALGFTPVSMPVADVYLAVEKGVLDGVFATTGILRDRRLGDVTKYVTEMDGGHGTFYVIMNQDVWNNLPPDIQRVFDEASLERGVDLFAKGWDKTDKDAEIEMKAKGIEFISLAPEERARWQKRMAPVKEEYIAELEAKGLPARKIYRAIEELGEK